MTAVWRIDAGEGPRLAAGAGRAARGASRPESGVSDLLQPGGWESLPQLAAGGEPVPAGHRVLAPVDGQEVWAAGVTYRRSRDARLAESGQLDVYDHVYDAERPELFFKAAAAARRAAPARPSASAPTRAWDVPEPELAVVVDAAGEIVAATRSATTSRRAASRARTRCTCRRRRSTGTASAWVPRSSAGRTCPT